MKKVQPFDKKTNHFLSIHKKKLVKPKDFSGEDATFITYIRHQASLPSFSAVYMPFVNKILAYGFNIVTKLFCLTNFIYLFIR